MDLCSGLGRCEGPLSNRSEPQGPYGPLVHATVTGRTTELATNSAVVNSHYQLGVPAESSAGQSVTMGFFLKICWAPESESAVKLSVQRFHQTL